MNSVLLWAMRSKIEQQKWVRKSYNGKSDERNGEWEKELCNDQEKLNLRNM